MVIKRVTALIVYFCFFSFNSIFLVAAKEPADAILASFPNQIGAFVAEAVHTYPHKELGASLSYTALGQGIIMVYLYDLGTHTIEDGIRSDAVLRSKSMAMKDIATLEARGVYRNLKNNADRPAVLDLGRGMTQEILHVSFSYDAVDREKKTNDPVISELYMLGLRGYICKIRATRRLDANEDEMKRAVITILHHLKQ